MSEDLWILILGLFFSAFGCLVLFSDQFLGHLKRTLWKDSVWEKINVPPRYLRLDDRYGRGLSTLILGLVFLGAWVALKVWS